MTLKSDALTRLMKESAHAEAGARFMGFMRNESKGFWIAFIILRAVRNLWDTYGTALYHNLDYQAEGQGLYDPCQ